MSRSQRSAEKFKNVPGAGHVYVKIRGGERGDKTAKKGDSSSEALIKVCEESSPFWAASSMGSPRTTCASCGPACNPT